MTTPLVPPGRRAHLDMDLGTVPTQERFTSQPSGYLRSNRPGPHSPHTDGQVYDAQPWKPADSESSNYGRYRTVSEVNVENIRFAPADLTGKITRLEKYPVAYGGFSDIWRCLWHNSPKSVEVAVKAIRTHASDDGSGNLSKKSKRLRRELQVWTRLDHANVLPLYGITSDFGHFPSMVCPWRENGTLTNFLEKRRTDLTEYNRWKLLSDIAAGLFYLHSCSVIHGDLSGSNVLIDRKGGACLADFGLSSVTYEFQGTSYFTSSIRGAVRWAAPELYQILESEDTPPNLPTTQSDIYSFSSVMFQVLSGSIPYHNLRENAQVLVAIISGSTPRRPRNLDIDHLQWSFIQRCWSTPARRPLISDILEFVRLQLALASPASGVGEEEESIINDDIMLPPPHRTRSQTPPLSPSSSFSGTSSSTFHSRGSSLLSMMSSISSLDDQEICDDPIQHVASESETQYDKSPSSLHSASSTSSTPQSPPLTSAVTFHPPTIQRPTNPPHWKPPTLLSKPLKVPMIPRDNSRPLLPLEVSVFTVVELGTVCTRQGFYTDRWIFPIGYVMERKYLSITDPTAEVTYQCSILDGTTGPRFQIVAADVPHRPMIATTPKDAWAIVVKQAHSIRNIRSSGASGRGTLAWLCVADVCGEWFVMVFVRTRGHGSVGFAKSTPVAVTMDHEGTHYGPVAQTRLRFLKAISGVPNKNNPSCQGWFKVQ
ncbi:kinase-like protein [Leucogyrophana mollusca]|uniref:Kinase-like protein n=1 Tax=Leucogyrophana mollusca TaxID=85980 RepID=A0ACB8BEJ3_9AGAM|nr:kinase-like protein [Leucogyrophana mollusca]